MKSNILSTGIVMFVRQGSALYCTALMNIDTEGDVQTKEKVHGIRIR